MEPELQQQQQQQQQPAPAPAAGDEAGPSSAVAAVPPPEQPFEHTSGIIPTLQNVVSTVNFDCKLDLKEIALHARNAEYNPKRFAAVIIRVREPRTTALIFASGKMVCTGARNEEASRIAARKFAKIVHKLGFPAKFKDFKVQNMVGSCDVKFPVRLEGLAFAHSLFCSYEPELFPGLIYRMKEPKVVLLIFVSGKVVLTGAKDRLQIYRAFENIYPVLQGFRKGEGVASAPRGGAPQLSVPPAPTAAATGPSQGATGPQGAQQPPYTDISLLGQPPPVLQ